MAVPKKRKSKTLKRISRTEWKKKAKKQAKKSLSLGKSTLNNNKKNKSFIYDI